eukprot:5366841-Prymnesium_polylepis.1
MVAMPIAAKQQVVARSGGRLFCRWSLLFHADPAKSEECRVGGDGEAERGRVGARERRGR